MKRKELKVLAQRMAKLEYIIQNSDDKKAIHKAQEEIMELTSKVDSMEDIFALDEMVIEILEKK